MLNSTYLAVIILSQITCQVMPFKLGLHASCGMCVISCHISAFPMHHTMSHLERHSIFHCLCNVLAILAGCVSHAALHPKSTYKVQHWPLLKHHTPGIIVTTPPTESHLTAFIPNLHTPPTFDITHHTLKHLHAHDSPHHMHGAMPMHLISLIHSTPIHPMHLHDISQQMYSPISIMVLDSTCMQDKERLKSSSMQRNYAF